MDFRAKVAIYGHIGVEADPAVMTVGERSSLAAHIALYKEWREVLHDGALSQLADGRDGMFGWLTMAGQRDLALIAQTRPGDPYDMPHVRFPILDHEASYRVTLLLPWPKKAAKSLAQPETWEDEIALSGWSLAQSGINLPLSQPETAWLVALKRL